MIDRTPTIELSRIEVGHVADVLEVLRGPYRRARTAAKVHDIPSDPFLRLLHRPASFSLREASLDAIAAAVGVPRAELLAGRAVAAARLKAGGPAIGARPSIELSRIEVARVADVLAVLRAPYRCVKDAAVRYGIPATPFLRLLQRPAAFSLQERSLDAIAAAVGVSRAELLAGRALAVAALRAMPRCAPSVELAHADVRRAAAEASGTL